MSSFVCSPESCSRHSIEVARQLTEVLFPHVYLTPFVGSWVVFARLPRVRLRANGFHAVTLASSPDREWLTEALSLMPTPFKCASGEQ